MNDYKITKSEIDALLEMLKKSLVEEIFFPTKGETEEFKVQGISKKDVFNIHIYRGKRAPAKHNIGAKIERNNMPILELHVNPSIKHVNPDGTEIEGSHWHIYTEEYGRRVAFPAEDLLSDDFVGNTIKFLEKFNVVEQPTIKHQLELF